MKHRPGKAFMNIANMEQSPEQNHQYWFFLTSESAGNQRVLKGKVRGVKSLSFRKQSNRSAPPNGGAFFISGSEASLLAKANGNEK